MPLSVICTYNSFNPNQSDFEYSWTCAINDFQVSFDEDRQMTDSLVDDDAVNMSIGGGRDVTLTLPDDRRVTFYYNTTPSCPTLRRIITEQVCTL